MTRVAPSDTKYVLPPRNLFDLVGANDLTNFLTVVRGVNPFDVSPGMQLILEKLETRPLSANPFVITTTELDVELSDIPHARDSRGNSALHVAASLGFSLMVEALVKECNCAVDVVNADGLTPLHMAARHGHVECVQMLFHLGADALSLTSFTAGPEFLRGRTSLFLAHYHQHSTVAAYLAAFCYPVNPMAGCDEEPEARAALLRAATHVDTLLFAQIFDAMDCSHAPCGPLPLTWQPPVVRTRVAEEIAGAVLPGHSKMVQEQLFIFNGLFSRRLLSAGTPAGQPISHLVQRILNEGHPAALRSVILHGVSVRCDPPLSSYIKHEGTVTEDQVVVRLLIEEVESRLAFEEALEDRRKKPRSKTMKGIAWDAKVELRGLQKQLREKGVAPLTLPS